MIKENRMKIHGQMMAEITHPDGTKEYREEHNLVLNCGIEFIGNAIVKSTSRPAAMEYIAIGSGNTAVSSTQTALTSEVARSKATTSVTPASLSFQVVAMFAAGIATGEIKEAGVCNASSAGTFLDRVVFPVINKGAYDTLKVMFEFTLSPDD